MAVSAADQAAARHAAYCGTCPYWEERRDLHREFPELPLLDYADGGCRRFPPRLTPRMEQVDGLLTWTVVSMFPLCEERQWCAEHPGRRPAAARTSVRGLWYALLGRGGRKS